MVVGSCRNSVSLMHSLIASRLLQVSAKLEQIVAEALRKDSSILDERKSLEGVVSCLRRIKTCVSGFTLPVQQEDCSMSNVDLSASSLDPLMPAFSHMVGAIRQAVYSCPDVFLGFATILPRAVACHFCAAMSDASECRHPIPPRLDSLFILSSGVYGQHSYVTGRIHQFFVQSGHRIVAALRHRLRVELDGVDRKIFSRRVAQACLRILQK
jgi:hypothetical protein